MLLTYVYQHTHECSRQGQFFEVRPTIFNGCVAVTHPICVETLVELELIEVRREG